MTNIKVNRCKCCCGSKTTKVLLAYAGTPYSWCIKHRFYLCGNLFTFLTYHGRNSHNHSSKQVFALINPLLTCQNHIPVCFTKMILAIHKDSVITCHLQSSSEEFHLWLNSNTSHNNRLVFRLLLKQVIAYPHRCRVTPNYQWNNSIRFLVMLIFTPFN
jgi:hypothetical protein